MDSITSIVNGKETVTETIDRKIYPYEEATKESLKYFNGDKLAADAWMGKYALKNLDGELYEKSPDQMHKRLAREFARIESKYPNPMSENQIYSLFKNFKYVVPQGSPMSGIGNDNQIVSLSNCFVIGSAQDTYGSIMRADEEQVQLMKRRGGVGHDLSNLRPAGSHVNNSAMTSTGVSSFMERYSHSTGEVAQSGRRGALMLTVSVKHPDAEEFIDTKMTPGKVQYANVSVRVDDEFMKAANEGRTYTQKFPIDSDNPFITKEVNAKSLLEKMVNNAWQSAEPGVLFWDTIKRESIPDRYSDDGFETTSTNPCGEIPLPPYDSCRLTLMNLFGYVKEPFTNNAEFDFPLFKEHAGYAQRLMDDLVDLEMEKIETIIDKVDQDYNFKDIRLVEGKLWEKIKDMAVRGRRTGLGITGEGDMLAALGLRYGSKEATNLAVKVHKNLAVEAYRSSVNMAKERGAFPVYDASKEEDNPFIQRIKGEDEKLYQKMVKYGRRNIALLTIAPAGTVSLQTQTTSGLENVFALIYTRRKKVNPDDKNVKVDFIDNVGGSWQEYSVFHHGFEQWLKIKGYNPKDILSLYENNDKEKLEKIIFESPYYKTTSEDTDWKEKVKMQGAIQKWVDHSISVTVNLPENISKEAVMEIYQTAWKEGCKGLTIYRQNSREGVLVNKGKEGLEKISMENPFSVPAIMPSLKINQKTPFGNMHMHLTLDSKRNYKPVEVFANLGNAGSLESASMEGLGRMTSLWLRSGGKIDKIIDQLENIGSGSSVVTRDGGVQSLEMGFARALQKFEVVRRIYDVGDVLTGKLDYNLIEAEISDMLRTGNGKNPTSDLDNPLEDKNKKTKIDRISEKCPQEGCRGIIIHTEGCEKCSSCDYTRC